MHFSGGSRLFEAATMEVENKLNNTQRTAETDTLTTTATITTGFYKFLARFSGKSPIIANYFKFMGLFLSVALVFFINFRLSMACSLLSSEIVFTIYSSIVFMEVQVFEQNWLPMCINIF